MTQENRYDNQRRPWPYFVLGGTNPEVIAKPHSVTFTGSHAAFQMTPDGPEETIPYTSAEPLAWGGKAKAATGLDSFAGREGFVPQNGGGLRNTAVQLAGGTTGRRVIAWDTSVAFPGIVAEFSRLGIEHRSLGLLPAGHNVILTRGEPRPARVCLCAPVSSTTQGSVKRDGTGFPGDFGFNPGGGVAVINSCKFAELTKSFSAAAQMAGIPQYSVVNRALPIGDRLAWLIGRDAASCCNLEEFCDLAPELRDTPDAQEESADLDRVASAIAAFGNRYPGDGDLAVTLGNRGTMVADRATGLIAQVALKLSREESVRRRLMLRPDLVLGSGDRFFAGFLASHAICAADRRGLALAAGLHGSIEVVRSYGLLADDGWFDVRLFPQRLANGFSPSLRRISFGFCHPCAARSRLRAR